MMFSSRHYCLSRRCCVTSQWVTFISISWKRPTVRRRPLEVGRRLSTWCIMVIMGRHPLKHTYLYVMVTSLCERTKWWRRSVWSSDVGVLPWIYYYPFAEIFNSDIPHKNIMIVSIRTHGVRSHGWSLFLVKISSRKIQENKNLGHIFMISPMMYNNLIFTVLLVCFNESFLFVRCDTTSMTGCPCFNGLLSVKTVIDMYIHRTLAHGGVLTHTCTYTHTHKHTHTRIFQQVLSSWSTMTCF